MSAHTFWALPIAALGFLVTADLAPALARGGATGIVATGPHFAGHARFAPPHFRARFPHIAARRFNVRNDFGRQRATIGSVVAWPYLWSLGPAPEAISMAGDQIPTAPPVIVVSGSPNDAPLRSGPQAPMDYGYVAGCHAIPGGYHCDTPRAAGTPP
jgi:hypothetical protein